jgi:hypothetical protein
VSDKPRRLQTQTERDMDSLRARKEREGAGIPEDFDDEEYTGKHDAEDLARLRATRTSDDRLRRLEKKHDAISDIVHETRADVREMKGQLVVLPDLVDEIRATAKETRDRESRRDAEDADVRKHRRERVTKLVGIVAALLSSGAALHWLAGKL